MAKKYAKAFPKKNLEKITETIEGMERCDDKSREEFPPVSYVYER